MKDMGKGRSFDADLSGDKALYGAMGYREGRDFDPTDKLAGAPDRAALVGG